MEQGILGEIYNIGTNFEIPVIQLARELVRLVCIFFLSNFLTIFGLFSYQSVLETDKAQF